MPVTVMTVSKSMENISQVSGTVPPGSIPAQKRKRRKALSLPVGIHEWLEHWLTSQETSLRVAELYRNTYGEAGYRSYTEYRKILASVIRFLLENTSPQHSERVKRGKAEKSGVDTR